MKRKTKASTVEERNARVVTQWRARCKKVRTGRAIPEWKGKTADSKIPDAVRDRVLETWGGACYLSGILIAGKPWQLEHVIPLSEGGEHREANLRPALTDAHAVKSAVEAGRRAKADAQRRKNNGTKPAPKRPIESAPMPAADPQQKATKPPEKGSRMAELRALGHSNIARRFGQA